MGGTSGVDPAPSLNHSHMSDWCYSQDSGIEILATVLETERCVAPEKHAVLKAHGVSVCTGEI